MAVADLGGVFGDRVHRRIHLPPERAVRRSDSLDHFAKADIADDQQVDVAALFQLIARRRAEHERRKNPWR